MKTEYYCCNIECPARIACETTVPCSASAKPRTYQFTADNDFYCSKYTPMPIRKRMLLSVVFVEALESKRAYLAGTKETLEGRDSLTMTKEDIESCKELIKEYEESITILESMVAASDFNTPLDPK